MRGFTGTTGQCELMPTARINDVSMGIGAAFIGAERKQLKVQSVSVSVFSINAGSYRRYLEGLEATKTYTNHLA